MRRKAGFQQKLSVVHKWSISINVQEQLHTTQSDFAFENIQKNA